MAALKKSAKARLRDVGEDGELVDAVIERHECVDWVVVACVVQAKGEHLATSCAAAHWQAVLPWRPPFGLRQRVQVEYRQRGQRSPATGSEM